MARGGNNNPKGKGGFGDHPECINTKGRPMHPAIKRFREALAKVEDEKGMSLIEFAIRAAYKDNKTEVLLGILRKYLPDLSVTDSGATTLKDIMGALNHKKEE